MCMVMFAILKRLNALHINMSLKLFMMQRIRLVKHTKERESDPLVMYHASAFMPRRYLIVSRVVLSAIRINNWELNSMN